MVEVYAVVKVFLFGVVIDVLWALYILAVAEKRRLVASIMSMAMAAPAILGFLEIVESNSLLFPYLLGLGCGTFIGMWFHEKLKKKYGIQ